jgi:hypothetical protein
MPCSNRDWQLELSSLQELSRRWCTGSSGTGAGPAKCSASTEFEQWVSRVVSARLFEHQGGDLEGESRVERRSS